MKVKENPAEKIEEVKSAEEKPMGKEFEAKKEGDN